MNGRFQLESEVWLPAPIGQVFDFFADAGNLEAITPAWLSFQVLTPLPIVMKAGALIDYRLKLHGLPVRWQTEITAWEPPFRFVDEQRRGPYSLWVHEHTFHEERGGTRVVDRVHYDLWLGRLLGPLFVRRDLERIFAYRREILRRTEIPLSSDGIHSVPPERAERRRTE